MSKEQRKAGRERRGAPGKSAGLSEAEALGRALQAEKAYLADIIRYTPALICGIAPDGSCNFANPAAVRATGYSEAEIVGQKWWDLLYPGAERAQVDALFKNFGNGAVRDYEMTLTAKDGSRRVVSWNSINRFDGEGRLLEVIAFGHEITKRKRAEAALDDEHRRLESIIKGTNVGTWEWNVQTGETVFNARWADIMGYTLEELAPISIETWVKHTHPDDLKASGAMLERVFRKELDYYEYEVRMKHKDGRWVWVLDRGSVASWTGDGKPLLMYGTHQDINTRRQVEEYRRMSHEVLSIINSDLEFKDAIRRILAVVKQGAAVDAVGIRLSSGDDFPYYAADGFPDGFMLTENSLFARDKDGGVCRGKDGRACLECACGLVLSGKPDPASPLVSPGGSCWTNDLSALLDIPACEDPRFHPRNRCALEGFKSSALVPIHARTKIAGLLQLNSRGQNCFSQPAIQALEDVASHIGEALMRKKEEDALREAKEAAERANAAKSEFLANMSHEIRTPMNAILGFSEILAGQVEDPSHKEFLATIRASGRSLLGLINDILDLSKIEAGMLKIECTAVDPRALFNEIQRIFDPEIKRKGLWFKTEIDPGLPPALVLDEIRMRQIFLNLVGNAVKFTSRGGITLSASMRNIHADRSAMELVFGVQDTGIGIDHGQQDLIFKAFHQQTGQSHAKYGGTGLGLAICKRLVEIMGGRISVTSAVGQGSLFQVTLADVPVAAAAPETAPGAAAQAPACDFEPARILLVDDVAVNRTLLRKFLDFPGFVFDEAETGNEALEAVRRRRPDLVLMDVKMPGMAGPDLLRRMKSDPSLAGIPVIVVTASAMKEQEDELKALGCDGYLRKPVLRGELIKAVSPFLKQRAPAKPAPSPQPAGRLDFDRGAADGDRARRAELAGLLRSEHMDAWRRISGNMNMNRIRDFAKLMGELAGQYGMAPLSAWADALRRQADTFDIERMKNTLESFPRLVDEIAGAERGKPEN